MSVAARTDAREELSGESSRLLHDLVDSVIEDLCAEGYLTQSSFERLAGLMRRFVAFVQRGYDLDLASDVAVEHVLAFLEAGTTSGSIPAVATKHLRRSAIRLLYRRATMIGLSLGDPTKDLALPPRSYLSWRPLTDDEVELCRSFARGSLSATREPAAWALSEAGARCSELPLFRAQDVDIHQGRVFIAGGAKTAPRWSELTDWGVIQVTRRLGVLKSDSPDIPLLRSDRGSRSSARASAYEAIRATLQRAGLGSEPDVRPNSLVAWRGMSALASGASIDEVARILGIRSLDAAASFIGWHWQGEEH